jgi:hypothetical protein
LLRGLRICASALREQQASIAEFLRPCGINAVWREMRPPAGAS